MTLPLVLLCSPAGVVGHYLAAALQGDALPPPGSEDLRVLLSAMRKLLAGSEDQVEHSRHMHAFACLALKALNERLRADVQFARLVNRMN